MTALVNSYLFKDLELSSSIILNYLYRPIIPLAPLEASLSFNFSAKASGSIPPLFLDPLFYAGDY